MRKILTKANSTRKAISSTMAACLTVSFATPRFGPFPRVDG
jgi:hypothetical protein